MEEDQEEVSEILCYDLRVLIIDKVKYELNIDIVHIHLHYELHYSYTYTQITVTCTKTISKFLSLLQVVG